MLNVTTCSDDSRLRLLGGVLGCARATEGLAWIISVRAIVNVKDRSTFLIYVADKIYTGWEGLKRWLEELDLRTQRAMIIKPWEEFHLYMSVCANIRLPMKEARLPTDTLVEHGCSMMCLDNQYVFADSLCSNMREARHWYGALIAFEPGYCWRKSSWSINVLFPKMECLRALSIFNASIRLRQCCRASKLGSSSLRRLDRCLNNVVQEAPSVQHTCT